MQLHTIITWIHLVSNCLERLCVLTCLEAAQDKSRRLVQDTGLVFIHAGELAIETCLDEHAVMVDGHDSVQAVGGDVGGVTPAALAL